MWPLQFLLDRARDTQDSYSSDTVELLEERLMKLSIESDGTLEGTHVAFEISANEIPEMIERSRSKQKKLRATQPPDIIVSPALDVPPENADP